MDPVESYAVNPGWAVLLADLGVDAGNVLRRASLPPSFLANGPRFVSQRDYFALWNAVEDEAADPELPIRIGEKLSPEVFDAALFAALCSEDLNAAATRIARYKKLCGPMRLLVSESRAETTLRYIWPGPETPPPLLAATELVFWVAVARLGTREPVRALRASLPDPPPNAAAYRDYLGVAPQRDSVQSVTFSAKDAARPFLTANDSMWSFFEPELRRRLAELEAGSAMRDQVHAALLELLPAGHGNIGAVARRLFVSTRSLQRHLKSEGTTFQACLDETREALARHYLTASSLSAAEIAFLVGYEDPNSFYRAFRSWTGKTPERVRQGV